MPKSVKYEYKRKQIKYYRNMHSFPDFPAPINFVFESVIFETKSLRKFYFKLKSLAFIMIGLFFFLALLEYKFLDNTVTSIGTVCAYIFIIYIFFLYVNFLILVSYLTLITALSRVASFIKQHKIMWIIVIIGIFFSFFLNTLVTLSIVCIITSILFIENIFSLHKNKHKYLDGYLNYRIAKKVVGKLKKLADPSTRTPLTFYIAVNLSMYTWFISLVCFLPIFNAPQGYLNIIIYILLVPLVYYTIRVVMYFKINEFCFLLFLLLSSFGIFYANVQMLNGLHLILTHYKIPAFIFNVRIELLFTGIEYLILIITIVKATNLTTIDALKRALTILFTITTTCLIVFKFVPYIVFPEVNFQEGDLKSFELISSFSFIPNLIGTLIGTIYVDIVKKKHEETKKREEERALRSLIYKSSLARPFE